MDSDGFKKLVNYLSINEPLPCAFYPVSPTPYLNGGPEDYLSRILESKSIDFNQDRMADWLESRLPSPVSDLAQWNAGAN